MSQVRTVAIVGATAAGKSSLAIEWAQSLDGEIVNADSMQLYRGMDIGTAKVGAAERRLVPHHLLDIWPVTQVASVAEYQALARAAIADIHDRGRIAILVGGSGLYVRAVLDDLEFPGTDPMIRADLEARALVEGPRTLHAELAKVDPAAAAAILPDNTRRIVRALEVVAMRGSFTATLPSFRYVIPAVQVGLKPSRDVLDARIDARVDDMFSSGLVNEVQDLIGQGLREGRTASRALGYAQALDHLDDTMSLDEARWQTAAATRRFARRQESWFGRDPRIQWLDPFGDTGTLAVEEQVRNVLGSTFEV
jgi:tRNA dimethylallyltransferase